MAIYKYLRQFWQGADADKELKKRMIQWRREPVTVRLEKPTRLDRARSVGYKAKEGFVVVRQRVNRGGRMRPSIVRGRRPKHNRQKKVLKLNYRVVAEGRAQEAFPNLTVLNSYLLAKDGQHSWYEIILVDGQHPNIAKDEKLKGLADKRGRVQRGLTNAGRRSRGLKGKGKGFEKTRPSLNANKGQGN
jgi:large subunit ribosomal protein L15e